MSAASVNSSATTSSSVTAVSGRGVGVGMTGEASLTGSNANAGEGGTGNGIIHGSRMSNKSNQGDQHNDPNPNQQQQHRRMETALDVLTLALQGDVGARSFLEQSCCIYVLDMSSGIHHAQIFGAWHVLHQAFNEIERATCSRSPSSTVSVPVPVPVVTNTITAAATAATTETGSYRIGPVAGDDGNHDDDGDYDSESNNNNDDDDDSEHHHIPTQKTQQEMLLSTSSTRRLMLLLPQTQLLAHMALKVARRSNIIDQQLVATCIENSSAQLQQQQQRHLSTATTSDTITRTIIGNNHSDTNTSANNSSNNNDNELQQMKATLIQANAELREMVIGRIAAFAFDDYTTNNCNNNSTQQQQHGGGESSSSSSSIVVSSPFADLSVVETLAKVIAANAVSNGPNAIKHCLLDWLVPSQTTLPPYALICVVLNIAIEAASLYTPSPVGTQDALQQSSIAIMSQVIGPVLQEAITHDSDDDDDDKTSTDDEMDRNKRKRKLRIDKSKIIAKSLQAIQAWNKITDLSLAQAKHICAKVKINLSDVLSEVMLSESPHVLDALADLLEATVERHFHRDTINMNSSDLAGTLSLSPSATTSRSTEFNIHTVWTSQKARMTQTRYIMQVDEEAFRSSGITYSQLHQIECKELGLLLDVLANTVALQSFRLVDPPASNSGPRNPHVSLTTSNDESHHRDDSFDTAATRLHSCSRSFARIAAAICWGISTAGDLNAGGFNITNRSCSVIILSRPKMLDLLLKCASHPSVVVCATILPVMTPILAQQMGLATQWLPILQRRAIIPHHHTIDNNTGHTSTISLDATDLCQVQYDEFAQGFRDTVLSDALLACFQSHPEFYVASCTAAIEEFCSVGVAAGSDSVTVQTSFHLEAALFVMACASDAVSDSTGTSSSSSNNDVVVVLERISSYLERCTAALAKIPPSLTSNPLAMVAACRFIMKYGKWYCANQPDGILDVASTICLYTFNLCGSTFPDQLISVVTERDCGVTPYGEAARSIAYLLRHNPSHFLSNKAIGELGAAWESSFVACNHRRKLLTIDDRKAICSGICHVLSSLPERQRGTSVMALALPSIGCLEAMVTYIGATTVDDVTKRKAALDRIAAEIVIVSTIARSFSNALWSSSSANDNDDHLGERYFPPIADTALTILRRAWPSIQEVSTTHLHNESILDSLGYLMKVCLPSDIENQASMELLRELCSIATTIIRKGDVKWRNGLVYVPVFNFVETFVKVLGPVIDETSSAILQGRTLSDQQYYKIHRLLQSTVFAAVTVMDDHQNHQQHYHPGSVLARAQQGGQQLQGNGQPAFETKTKPPPASSTVDPTITLSSVGLVSMFSFLTTCMKYCPHFLIGMTVRPSPDDDEEGSLLERTVDLAVSSLLDFDSETCNQAMLFLGAVLVSSGNSDETAAAAAFHASKKNTNVSSSPYAHDDPTTKCDNDTIKELQGRIQPAVLKLIPKGLCGKLPFDTVPVASKLLCTIGNNKNNTFLCEVSSPKINHYLNKSEANETTIRKWWWGVLQQGLLDDHYLLGDAIRVVLIEYCALHFITTATNPTTTSTGLERCISELFEGLWHLHHVSDNSIRPLASSDLARIFHDAYKTDS